MFTELQIFLCSYFSTSSSQMFAFHLSLFTVSDCVLASHVTEYQRWDVLSFLLAAA